MTTKKLQSIVEHLALELESVNDGNQTITGTYTTDDQQTRQAAVFVGLGDTMLEAVQQAADQARRWVGDAVTDPECDPDSFTNNGLPWSYYDSFSSRLGALQTHVAALVRSLELPPAVRDELTTLCNPEQLNPIGDYSVFDNLAPFRSSINVPAFVGDHVRFARFGFLVHHCCPPANAHATKHVIEVRWAGDFPVIYPIGASERWRTSTKFRALWALGFRFPAFSRLFRLVRAVDTLGLGGVTIPDNDLDLNAKTGGVPMLRVLSLLGFYVTPIQGQAATPWAYELRWCTPPEVDTPDRVSLPFRRRRARSRFAIG